VIDTHEVESYIGHQTTAQLISKVCGKDIPVERREAKFQPGDVVLVFALNRRVSGEVVDLKPADFRLFKVVVY